MAAYLVHCERRLGEEYERCEAYLGPALRRPLKDILDGCLLEAHLGAILEGARALLAGCQEQDLGRLYGCAAAPLGFKSPVVPCRGQRSSSSPPTAIPLNPRLTPSLFRRHHHPTAACARA